MQSPQPERAWRNSYWMLRHGRSKANDSCTIVSAMENGVKLEYGLTAMGRKQAAAAGEKLKGELGPSFDIQDRLLLLVSPFSRTVQTADEVGKTFGITSDDPRYQLEPDLRERFFGTAIELLGDEYYKKVWADDDKDPCIRPGGDGESVQNVADRMVSLVQRVDAQHSGKTIVLVSHCDTLAIGEAAIRGTPLRDFFQYHMMNCELRRLL